MWMIFLCNKKLTPPPPPLPQKLKDLCFCFEKRKLYVCVILFFLQTFQTWNRVNILASLTMKLSYAGEMLETNFNSASRWGAPHTKKVGEKETR